MPLVTIQLPIYQLLSIWNDLDDAYYKQNSFGGNTAEIYAIRIEEYHPFMVLADPTPTQLEARKEFQQNYRREVLCAILEQFAEMRECNILIEDQPFITNVSPTFRKEEHPFWKGKFIHRVHVTIVP